MLFVDVDNRDGVINDDHSNYDHGNDGDCDHNYDGDHDG